MVVNVECMAGGGWDGRLAERGDVRLLFLLQQVIHLIWCHDSLHLDLPAIHAQDLFHFSRVMTLAQKICTLVGGLAVMPPYFLCSFVLIQCIIISFTTLWHPTAAVPIPLSISIAITLIRCNYNTRATVSSKKNFKSADEAHYTIIQGASVNRVILQHCFFWFRNTGADAAITILLPTLKRFSCNGAMDWNTACFCSESILEKWWKFCDHSAWILKRVRDSSQLCCSIKTWVWNFEATGSTLKKKGCSVKTVPTPENIVVVREAIKRIPDCSACRHSVSLGLSEASVWWILHKDLHFYPYKIQVTHALHERDYVNRVNFCQTFLRLINENQELVNNLLMSGKAHFHLSGFVNKQNFRYWSATNPTKLHERPLHSSKVTVWCAISSFGIIGPYSFEDEKGL